MLGMAMTTSPQGKISARRRDGQETIDTRYGSITVNHAQAITFPQGPLGMPDLQMFYLTHFPNPKMERFKLLQSLEDAEVSFITLPLEVENPLIAMADIDIACADLGFDKAALGLLLIVTVHRLPSGVKLSANVRAPLFLDSEKRMGAQYVFRNDAYKIQHYIS